MNIGEFSKVQITSQVTGSIRNIVSKLKIIIKGCVQSFYNDKKVKITGKYILHVLKLVFELVYPFWSCSSL